MLQCVCPNCSFVHIIPMESKMGQDVPMGTKSGEDFPMETKSGEEVVSTQTKLTKAKSRRRLMRIFSTKRKLSSSAPVRRISRHANVNKGYIYYIITSH